MPDEDDIHEPENASDELPEENPRAVPEESARPPPLPAMQPTEPTLCRPVADVQALIVAVLEGISDADKRGEAGLQLRQALELLEGIITLTDSEN